MKVKIELILSTILLILILNDFLLHLIGQSHPLWSQFNWIWRQGYDYYDNFWSFYWGIAFVISGIISIRLYKLWRMT